MLQEADPGCTQFADIPSIPRIRSTTIAWTARTGTVHTEQFIQLGKENNLLSEA